MVVLRYMKKLISSLLALLFVSSLQIVASENEPAQKKRRIESHQEIQQPAQGAPIESFPYLAKFKEYCVFKQRYRHFPQDEKYQVLTKIIKNPKYNSNESRIRGISLILSCTYDITEFNLVITLLQKMPKSDLIELLHQTKHILHRFPESSILKSLFESIEAQNILPSNNLRLQTLLAERQEDLRADNLTIKKEQEKILTELIIKAIECKTENDLDSILNALSYCEDSEQVIFLEKHFELLFKENTTPEKACRSLLRHLQSILRTTDNYFTLGTIAKILGQVRLAEKKLEEQDQIAEIAIKFTREPNFFSFTTSMKDLINDYIEEMISIINFNHFWLTPYSKEEILKKEKASDKTFLETLEELKKLPDEAFIKKFSETATAKWFIQEGNSHYFTGGIDMTQAQTVFFSKGSKRHQKLSPEAQIAFLQALQSRPIDVKKKLLTSPTLWNDIIDNSVAIEYLKTIQDLPEEEQIKSILQENDKAPKNTLAKLLEFAKKTSPQSLPSNWPIKKNIIKNLRKDIETCLKQYPTAGEFENNFFEALITHVSKFTKKNRKKILQSELFTCLIPHLGISAKFSETFCNILKTLRAEEQLIILENCDFLRNYLSNYYSGPSIIKTIGALPEKSRLHIFKKIFLTTVDAELSLDRLEKTLTSDRRYLLFEEILKLTPSNQIELLHFYPKIIYQLIKDSENEAPINQIKSLIDRLIENIKNNPKMPDATNAFSFLFTNLLRKPSGLKTKEIHAFVNQIPRKLPYYIQGRIAENLLEENATLLASWNKGKITQWLAHYNIMNQLFNRLEEQKDLPHVQELFTRLQKKQSPWIFRVKDFFEELFKNCSEQSVKSKDDTQITGKNINKKRQTLTTKDVIAVTNSRNKFFSLCNYLNQKNKQPSLQLQKGLQKTSFQPKNPESGL